jgi:hypothetical protein
VTAMVASRKLSDAEKPRCTEEGCASAAAKRGLCSLHYRRHAKDGTLPTKWLSMASGVAHEVEAKAPTLRCKYPRCRSYNYCRGYCQMHYERRYHAEREAREHVQHPEPWRAGQSMNDPDEPPESVDEFLGRKCREECDPSYIKHPQPDD